MTNRIPGAAPPPRDGTDVDGERSLRRRADGRPDRLSFYLKVSRYTLIECLNLLVNNLLYTYQYVAERRPLHTTQSHTRRVAALGEALSVTFRVTLVQTVSRRPLTIPVRSITVPDARTALSP